MGDQGYGNDHSFRDRATSITTRRYAASGRSLSVF
jgi:hypothetical protein